MIVDVVYEGLTLARGANARSEGDALYVELESPMPVGTALVIRTPEGDRAGRVTSVNEGNGPGVTVRFGAAPKAAPEPAAPAPVEESKNGESDDDEASDKKGGSSKRGRRRKTTMGH